MLPVSKSSGSAKISKFSGSESQKKAKNKKVSAKGGVKQSLVLRKSLESSAKKVKTSKATVENKRLAENKKYEVLFILFILVI